MGRTGASATVPAADDGAAELTQHQKQEPTQIIDGQWPRFIAGGPNEVQATLEQMIEESGADELMVQDLIADPTDRRHSHALLAQSFGLSPHPPTTTSADTNQ